MNPEIPRCSLATEVQLAKVVPRLQVDLEGDALLVGKLRKCQVALVAMRWQRVKDATGGRVYVKETLHVFLHNLFLTSPLRSLLLGFLLDALLTRSWLTLQSSIRGIAASACSVRTHESNGTPSPSTARSNPFRMALFAVANGIVRRGHRAKCLPRMLCHNRVVRILACLFAGLARSVHQASQNNSRCWRPMHRVAGHCSGLPVSRASPPLARMRFRGRQIWMLSAGACSSAPCSASSCTGGPCCAARMMLVQKSVGSDGSWVVSGAMRPKKTRGTLVKLPDAPLL